MVPDLIIFIVGVVVGGIAAHLYFDTERKRLSGHSLTIETIVHEIKTPLTGLSWIFNSLSNIKQNEAIGEENLNLIKEGIKQTGNAMSLANDALTAINATADHTSYNFQINNLIDVISKVIEENSLGAKEKHVNIKLEEADDIPSFPFDAAKITLALRNIINNAVKYTPTGGNVSVSVRKEDNRVAIIISDTGVGIPTADLGKVSNKFFRASNVDNTSGSGLGLFIVKNIIAGHNGKIDIQSKEREGTKVTIFLPIK